MTNDPIRSIIEATPPYSETFSATLAQQVFDTLIAIPRDERTPEQQSDLEHVALLLGCEQFKAGEPETHAEIASIIEREA